MNNYYLGIDVSKGYADFVMLDKDKIIVEKNFQLEDTFEHHNLLYQFLSGFISEKEGAEVYAAVESTGGYENNWYKTLKDFQKSLNIRVARLNPIGISHEGKAEMKRNTTDAVSAVNIAEYQINHKGKVKYDEVEYYTSIRKQWTTITMFVKQRTQLLNQLEKIIYGAFPEILTYCKHGVPEWVLSLLSKYPTAKRVASSTIEEISKIPYISMKKAKKLIERSNKSVASSTDENIEDLIKCLVEQIRNLDKLKQTSVERMIKSCNLPEVQLLKSFKGIGDYSAIGLIIEIGSINRFESSKKLSSFFGLHPVLKTSGDGTTKVHMSKRGSSQVRCLLYNITRSAIVFNPLIRELYNHYLKKGMCRSAAIGVIMHKILRIVYGMLKNQQCFNPDIDKNNREKFIPKKQFAKIPKSRRLANYDTNAPISRRQSKKRNERVKSQNDNDHSLRDHSPLLTPT